MFQNKVVFITGGANGIGFQIAKDFAAQGAAVIIGDLSEAQLQKAHSTLAQAGLVADGILCDVTQEEQIKQAFDFIMQKYGRLDVLVNNAGLQYISPIEDFPTTKFELLLKVMLVAPFVAIKHAFPIMKKQAYGRIVNMASINGLIGFAGKSAYNSAKHGVIGLTKVAALECAQHGITVNAVCPGYVDTDLVRNQLDDLAKIRHTPKENILHDMFKLVPQKRLLTVEEISAYVLFLASDAARGVTGQAVVIDGGYTAQ